MLLLLLPTLNRLCSNTLVVGRAIVLEHLICVNLSRVADVGVVEQVLDTKHNLMLVQSLGDQLTCLIVIAGFQDFSSSRMDRQIVPEG